jgi:hypothetical protein
MLWSDWAMFEWLDRQWPIEQQELGSDSIRERMDRSSRIARADNRLGHWNPIQNFQWKWNGMEMRINGLISTTSSQRWLSYRIYRARRITRSLIQASYMNGLGCKLIIVECGRYACMHRSWWICECSCNCVLVSVLWFEFHKSFIDRSNVINACIISMYACILANLFNGRDLVSVLGVHVG